MVDGRRLLVFLKKRLKGMLMKAKGVWDQSMHERSTMKEGWVQHTVAVRKRYEKIFFSFHVSRRKNHTK